MSIDSVRSESLGVDSDEFAAKHPHCGVCRHVRFLDDWDRTPYCSRTERVTEIDVGTVCTEFSPSP